MGLAFLSKFSAIPFLLSAFFLCYVGYLAACRPNVRQEFQRVRARFPSAILAGAVALFVVWAGYRFSFGMTDLLPFRVPAPEVVSGIEALLAHNRIGHVSYLLGVRDVGGFWYYYPVALAVKTPVAMLVLFGFLAVAAVRKRYPILVPLLFSASIILFSMLFSNINIETGMMLAENKIPGYLFPLQRNPKYKHRTRAHSKRLPESPTSPTDKT